MNYPLITEYIEAIKSAEDNLNELANLRPVIDDNGDPVFSSGNFAVVFKMEDEQTGKLHALKCFLKEQAGREEAYRLIAQELECVKSIFLTPVKYLERELFVDTNVTVETEFPVLLMDWVEGVTLDRYIQNSIDKEQDLSLLFLRFKSLSMWLISQPFAHGDLKPDNILVRDDGSLVLVDYDGMYVPAMKGQKARELGSPNFRHPLRKIEDFDEHIDDFPLMTITLSIQIILANRCLYDKYGKNDGVIFHEADFMDLANSELNSDVLSQIATGHLSASSYSLFLMTLARRKLTKQLLESVFDTNDEELDNRIQCLNAKRMCNEGHASEADLKKAYGLFEKLSDKQYDDAILCYSCCMRYGYGCDKNETKGMELLIAQANKGNARAQLTLGIYYRDGKFVSQNYQKSAEWFVKSAEQGDPRAQRRLGRCYECGQGVPQDYQKAAEWYAKSAEQGDSEAQRCLGVCYEYGLGVPQDYQKAAEWYAKSAKQGDSVAQRRLGVCFYIGNGVPQDYQKAAEWYVKSAEQGDSVAQRRLGVCFYLGNGVPQDYQKAAEWYAKSAEQGDSEAQRCLGICYEFGHGVPQDYQKAAEWYAKSAEQGDSVAQRRLGICYESGHGVPQDYQKAAEWFAKSAEQGDSVAQCRLGLCYERGRGVPRDYQKAAEWFAKSAEQGDSAAQCVLAICYEVGLGVSRDYQKAVEWYTKSAEQGNVKSKQALERLNNINDNTTNVIYGTFTDPRDGYTYKTIKIGNKTWFAENLRYLPIIKDGFCVYGYKGRNLIEAQRMKNYDDFGALYSLDAAIKACPPGWHIPSDKEWQELTRYLGETDKDTVRKINTGHSVINTTFKGDYGTRMIDDVSLWKSGALVNNVRESIGFSALPGGWRTFHSEYIQKGELSLWWSSTIENSDKQIVHMGMCYHYGLYFNDKGVARDSCAPNCCLSVRCIKDY